MSCYCMSEIQCGCSLFQALIGAIDDDLEKRSSLRRGSMVGVPLIECKMDTLLIYSPSSPSSLLLSSPCLLPIPSSHPRSSLLPLPPLPPLFLLPLPLPLTLSLSPSPSSPPPCSLTIFWLSLFPPLPLLSPTYSYLSSQSLEPRPPSWSLTKV